MTKLYTLIQEEVETGRKVIIYKHAAENVIVKYLMDHILDTHRVIVQEYDIERCPICLTFKGEHIVRNCVEE